METIVMLSADLYHDIYENECEFWTDTYERIINLGKQFEKQLNWNTYGTEDRDYIEELERFEQQVRSTLTSNK